MIDDIEPASVEEAGQGSIAPVEPAREVETPKEPAGPSLRETLVKSLKDAKARGDKEAGDAPASSGAEKNPAEGGEEEETDNAGPGDKKPARPQKPAAAPVSWSAQARAKFAALDPVVRNEILKRERDVAQGFGRLDAERALGRQIREIATPYLAHIQAEGGDPAGAFNDYLKTSYLMRTGTPQQKGQALLAIARQFNADLTAQNSPAVHPAIQSLQHELATLKQRDQQRLHYQQQQEHARFQADIDRFAADPRHVHYHDVVDDMNALLSTGRANDLQQAYDMAVWARPEIRSTLLSGQKAEAEAKRRSEAKSRADAARRAGSSVTGSPGLTAPAAPPDRSLRDELRANLNAARS